MPALSVNGTDTGIVSEDGILTVSADLKISDTTVSQTLFTPETDIPGQYGSLTIESNGKWTYTLDNLSSFVQELRQDQVASDVFLVDWNYQIFTTITVAVIGKNDAALVSGNQAMALDTNVQTTVTGHLDLTDTDSGEKSFRVLTRLDGRFGYLSMTTGGTLTYYLASDWPTMEPLSAGQPADDVFTIFTLDGTEAPVKVSIRPTLPTYTLTASSATVNEGASTTFTLTTTAVALGTALSFNLSGISAADVLDGSLTGTVVVGASGVGTFTVALVADNLTEGVEILVATVGNSSLTTHATATGVVINDTSLSSPSVLDGTSGNDTLRGTAANDTINGGSGIDIVIFKGIRAAYSITHSSDGSLVAIDRVGTGGTDLLRDVERLEFADTKIAFDLNGSAGSAAKFIAVALGPDYLAPSGNSIKGTILSIFDSGTTMSQLAAIVVNMDAFIQMEGTGSNSDFIKFIHKNVIGTPPTTTQLGPLVAILDSGMTQGDFLAAVAELGINVDLVGLVTTGFEYA